MISQHFNTTKHKKKCLFPANQLLQDEFGSSNDLTEAFDNKCRSNRELKKLNHEYKDELDKLKYKYEALEKLNIKLLEKFTESLKPKKIVCDNLIDL
jgi:hypothetical protein